MALAQLGRAKPEAARRAGREVLHKHVRARHQPGQRLLARGALRMGVSKGVLVVQAAACAASLLRDSTDEWGAPPHIPDPPYTRVPSSSLPSPSSHPPPLHGKARRHRAP